MNTDRDNFHDWARDKPDSTSFSGLQRTDLAHLGSQPGVRWGRLAFLAALGVALVVGIKYVARL